MSTNSQMQRQDVLQNRIGLRLAARLSAGASELPHDIQERLRVARKQALARRKLPQVARQSAPASAPAVVQQGGVAVMGLGGGHGDMLGFWGRLTSVALVLGLAIGLVVINIVQGDDRASDVATVDAALLTDDLPPQAYTDAGFLQFLKTKPAESGANASASQ